jgi:hypothetical protein
VFLFSGDRFKLFATRLELFVDLDGLPWRLLVGFLRIADEREILAGGDSPAAVGIQSDLGEWLRILLLGKRPPGRNEVKSELRDKFRRSLPKTSDWEP